jgi:TonB family protein
MLFVTAPLVAQACRNPYQDATVIRPAPPVYPDSARELGLGIVSAKVIVTLSPTGSVIGIKIAQSTGNMALDHAALVAARQSTYSPKIVNCEPVAGDYMFRVTFDPERNWPPSLARMPGATPPSSPSPYPSPSPEEACAMQVVGARWGFDTGRQRRDYDRALQSVAEASSMQAGCAAKIKSPQRFSLEMLAGSTLSRAADLAFQLGRYQQARTFATQANTLYAQMLLPSIDQNYARFLTPNAKANLQANDDLLQRIARRETCVGSASAPITSLVLSRMPAGSSVPGIGVAGKYAVAIAYGPGGYAVRSFLLVNQGGWKVRASEGGAFDLAAYQRNGVPASIASKLASSVACAGA